MTTLNGPPAADAVRSQIELYLKKEQWAAAAASLQSLVQHAPRDVPSRLQLASVLLRQGQLRAATQQLLDTVPLLPNHAPLIAHAASRLSVLGEVQAARACLDHLERAPNPPAEVLATQAHLRWMLGEIPTATSLITRAMAGGADSRDEHYLHALLLQFAGELAQAEQELVSCLRRWPDFGDAAVMLANLRRQTPESNHLALLRSCIERLPRGHSEQEKYNLAEFESARFKVLDDQGLHEEAWSALARSNALMHELNPYDGSAEAALTDALVGMPSIGIEGVTARAPEGPIPVFIVGMPRSGTTLLSQMLAGHSQIVAAGEINDFACQMRWMADVPPGGADSLLRTIERAPTFDFLQLGERYLKQTQWRAQGRRFYIDKLPANIRMVPFIRRALPHAQILHVVRDPMDVCFSNLKVMFGLASAYCYDQEALAHYYKQYLRLAMEWQRVMPGSMLDISYEALVTEPGATLSRVLERCGLKLEEGCLHPELNRAPVATRSSTQVRERVHSRAFGEWRPYAEHLGPLRLALL